MAKNPYRIPVAQLLAELDGGDLCEMMMDSVVDACCTEGCQVEPDGVCEHGCPSILRAAGMI